MLIKLHKRNNDNNSVCGLNRNKKRSQYQDVWRRLKKNKLATAGMVVVLVLMFCAIFADYIAPYPYDKQDLPNRFTYPSWEHPMGTDNFGRDILSRVIYGGRISLTVAFCAVTMGLVIGGVLGSTAAYYGGIYENIVMRVVDIMMAVPSILLAISISAALGSGVGNTAFAIGFGAIPTFARVTRASVLTIKDQEYIEAAQAIGANKFRIIYRHIIPNALAPIIVQSTLRLAESILVISSLSFIGLGVQPPIPEWGSILASGRDLIRDFWPIVTFPGIAIMITLISFNLFGDGLRDALDPRLKN